jgi:uncharacterized radical SAM superfamily Fe-S cluster-containing enzyme
MIEGVAGDEAAQAAEGPPGPAAPTGAEDVPHFQQKMRRFAHLYASPPVETQATCPTCGQVVGAVFERIGEQIVLALRCDACGPRRRVHHDAIWTDLPSDFPGSATRTYCGSRVHPAIRRLPRTVETLCPACAAIVVGRYFVADGAVFIEKACPEHGHFRDCVNSDVLLYSKAAWWTYEEHPGHERPHVTGAKHCPSDCGLCNQHLSGSVLAQIDLTNRCNMRCPICFANAGVTGNLSEPTYEQHVRHLQALRDFRPTPCTAIQFTGGEPTVHPDFLRIVAKAREMGFSHIQIATNGIRMADRDFAAAAAEAGLHTLYLQFDGVGPEPHRQTRNYPGIWDRKLATIDNCRKLGLKICLVPTIVRGVNDDQVGEIFHFAVANIDTISAISYQPVSFSGRIDAAERLARRYTLGHLAHDIAAASGASALRDMYPLSIVTPLSQILAALTGRPKIRPTCHPDCAFGTYFFVSPDKKAYPFPRVLDIEGMFCDMNRLARGIRRRGRATWWDKLRVLRMFKRHFRRDAAPPGLTVQRFIRSLRGLVDKHAGRGEGEALTYKTLLCAGMHFQDRYNFDVERAKRCVILYSTPAGVFPFCTWNCGPEYRKLVEQQVARRREGAAETAPGPSPAIDRAMERT